MPKIYLHIGTNKTGTTAIQEYFHSNSDNLRQLGILYPLTGRGDLGAGEILHNNLAAALGYGGGAGNRAPNKIAAALKSALEIELAQANCGIVVISSENFVLRRDASIVADFFKPHDVSVIVYLRRHDEWLESLLTQAIKSVPNPPWKLNVEGFLEHQKTINGQFVDYLDLLEHWGSAFGKENIIVRPYETQQNQPDLISDFLFAINAEENSYKLSRCDKRLNTSVPARALMMIVSVNHSKLPLSMKRFLTKNIVSEFEDSKSVSILPPGQRRKLAQSYEDDYKIIAREYLNRPDGRLYFDEICSAHEGYEPLGKTRKLAVVEFAYKLLVRSVRQIYGLRRGGQ